MKSKRRSHKRKSHKRKSHKRKSHKRKSHKRKSHKRKSHKRGFGLVIGKQINRGNSSTIHEVFEDDGRETNYVAKVYNRVNDRLLNEVNIQIAAGKLGLAPAVIDFHDNTLIMEKIEGPTLTEYVNKYPALKNTLVKKAEKAFIKLYDNGINYLDKTGDNIIVGNGNKIYIIDYDISRFENVPELERDLSIIIGLSDDVMKNLKEQEAIEQQQRLKEKLEKIKLGY